jgi:hypothetical protein
MIHMASIHGGGIGFTIFLFYYMQNVLVKNFLISRCGFIFSIFVDMRGIFVALTSSTRL